MKRSKTRNSARKQRMAVRWAAIAVLAICAVALGVFGRDKAPTYAETGASQSEAAEVTTVTEVSGGVFSASDLFTSRDLTQTADLTDAVTFAVSDGDDIHITEAGVYVLSGTARNATVYVEAADDAKVQLVLDGLTVVNDDSPCIYVSGADKVFITVKSDSSLTVSGAFSFDGDSKADGAIFSRTDLTLNGTAALTVSSGENGVVCKDDLMVTGGAYVITAASKAVEANDSIRVAGGSLSLTAGTDGLHAENGDDDSLGYIYIGGGSLTISARDDGIHATSVVQIDAGEITVSAGEGIEGTYIQLNGGTVSISASDDGVNAGQKSGAYRATIEINGGEITVNMGSGDTDGIDSNGDIYVNGGTVIVNGNSSFDYDGTAQYNGGTIIVNGQQISYIPNQFMSGMGGNMGGSMGKRGR